MRVKDVVEDVQSFIHELLLIHVNKLRFLRCIGLNKWHILNHSSQAFLLFFCFCFFCQNGHRRSHGGAKLKSFKVRNDQTHLRASQVVQAHEHFAHLVVKSISPVHFESKIKWLQRGGREILLLMRLRWTS